MQLVAYGAQDIYLTGNPQITFFKVVYRRHTNFSMEAIRQTLNGTFPAINTSGRQTVTVARNGDLVSDCWLEFSPTQGAWTSVANNGANPFTAMIDNITVEIGGQEIDKHTGTFMETYYQLTKHNPGVLSNPITVSQVGSDTYSEFQHISYCGGTQGAAVALTRSAFVPLNFWFCRNPGLALPLIALQYHEVKFNLTFDRNNVPMTDTSGSPLLWCNYIYLDTDERRRFAQVSHEYLIEQVQTQNGGTATNIDLIFNHPVKELIFIGNPNTGAGNAQNGKSTPSVLGGAQGTQGDRQMTLSLNGHQRFAPQNMIYFTRKQVNDYHTGNGGVNNKGSIGVYSFALKPEEHQPSGTCNFSRIDNARMQFFSSAGASVTTGIADGITIFAVNYNVLRIMSGMGGLAYSN